MKAWMSLNFFKIQDLITYYGVNFFERLKKMDYVVITLASKILIGASSFFDVTRTTIKAWMNSKFCRIRPGTYEFPDIEHLENSP